MGCPHPNDGPNYFIPAQPGKGTSTQEFNLQLLEVFDIGYGFCVEYAQRWFLDPNNRYNSKRDGLPRIEPSKVHCSRSAAHVLPPC